MSGQPYDKEAERMLAIEFESESAMTDDARLRDWMLARLEELRANPTEDAVLDLMDRVSGWVSPHLLPPTNSGAALSAPAGLDHLAELLRQLDAVDEPADWNAAASALIGHVRYLVSGTGGLSHDR